MIICNWIFGLLLIDYEYGIKCWYKEYNNKGYDYICDAFFHFLEGSLYALSIVTNL